jgi:hypothetical protein
MNEGGDHPDQATLRHAQTLLFPQSARQLCDAIGLNWWAAIKLHADGWLSFNPENANALDEKQEHELRFVGSLVTGGCSPQMLAGLLKSLEHPYCYNGRQIYYDWAERRWRLLPTPSPDSNPAAIFAEWLDSLKSDGDFARLEEIKTEVEQVLQSFHFSPRRDAPAENWFPQAEE